MKTETTLLPDVLVAERSRATDYLELTRPRIAVMVLFTVGLGALLAAPTAPDLAVLFHVVLGTGLVAAAASVLNQFLERGTDARMRRTENRPLPAGRVHPAEALALGVLLGAGGILYLLVSLRQPWTPLIASGTLVSYVALYTPAKRRTTLNTLLGAVPGALPPVIGWSAMTGGSVGALGWVLFLVMFLWQVPHFLAIAWIHREDYARAGLRMLPCLDPRGTATGRQMVLYCLTLLPVGLLPATMGAAGLFYVFGTLALGIHFLGTALEFLGRPDNATARRVLVASLIYLPLFFGLLFLDPWVRNAFLR